MVEIHLANGTCKFRPQHALQIIDPENLKSLRDNVLNDRFGKVIDLRRLITYEKLKGTLHEVIYSMESAQIDFLPYQFKPVLKFINSPTERLILADEVGLGKTIEAGLIWTEMQARYKSNRLLVVCPKILADKWREELRGKFQIDARIIDFNGLKHELTELKKVGPSHPFILIGTYSGLRPPKDEKHHLRFPPEEAVKSTSKTQTLREMKFWDEEYPPFDMVIFDEAHYMRNQATTTFLLGESLATNARAVLCISATPVNNKNLDLHSLLRLVDEEFFATQASFDDLILANKPTVHASNALASAPVDTQSLLSAIKGMAHSEYIKKSPLFEQLITRLEKLIAGNFKDISEIAKCQDALEKLNLLGSYVNRTRRIQVKENRAIRAPIVARVEYTQEEMALYRAILKLVRQRCRLNRKPFHVFQIMTLQLMAASCLPAFSQKVLTEELDNADLLEESMGDMDENDDLQTLPDITSLKQLMNYNFENNDSKFKQLQKIINEQAGEKIIIFAYYRPTLAYLYRKLKTLGEKVALIHGGIDIENRWKEIERFKDPKGCRILLASEVGSEGIDLQFCRMLINYDLPWNPMRVEQRIGRIDRVGQKAERLSIINFKISGTIEERIFERLHEKLEAFSSSLGDLDDVIGEEVKQLTIELLSEDLTIEEEQRKISQTQQAIEQKVIAIKELEESGDAFVALSDYVQRKVEEDRGRGRYVQSMELENYLTDFFDRNFKGTEINYNTPVDGCIRLRLSEEARGSLLNFMNDDRSLIARPLRMKDVCLCFSRERMKDIPEEYKKKVHFANHLSPLIRWMTKINKDHDHNFNKLSAGYLETNAFKPGVYFYRIERWIIKGIQRIEKLAYAAVLLGENACLSMLDAEQLFQAFLADGKDWPYRNYNDKALPDSYDLTEAELENLFNEAVNQFEIENESMLQTKKNRIANIFDKRIEQDTRRLESAQIAGRDERVLRLARGRLEKAKETKAAKLNLLDKNSQVSPETEPVAVGIICVAAE